MRSVLSPVVIVSAFGRGHALAQELRLNDIPVALLDVSPHLGESTAEDEEGPFGFFSQGLSASESQKLLEDSPLLQVQGFTWMLSKGPLEMRGPLAMLHREAFEIPETVWNWSFGEGPTTVKDHQYLLNGDFTETWFYHLSRAFHSNHWSPNYRAGLVDGSLPFGSDFMLRSVYRGGLQKSFETLAQAGVDVRAPIEILDVAREGNQFLKSLEIRKAGSDSTELLSFETAVWFLSSEETERLSPKLQEKLFANGVLRPKGSWMRARLKIPASAPREALPLHCVWIQDVDLPWTHDNMFVVERTPNAELFDVWMRVPESFRFQREYVVGQIGHVIDCLEKRIGVVGLTISEEPTAIRKSSAEVGPSRFPLYDEKEWQDYRQPKWRNFDWIAPETSLGLGWNFMFTRARKTSGDLKAWWKQREDERKKRELKALQKTNAANGVTRD